MNVTIQAFTNSSRLGDHRLFFTTPIIYAPTAGDTFNDVTIAVSSWMADVRPKLQCNC